MSDDASAWKPLLDELERRRAGARAMGGPERLARPAYDDVVDPRELRNALLAALRLARGRRDEAPGPVGWVGIRP